MYRITLAWQENNRIRTRTIADDDYTLYSQKIIIGRGNDQECDIVLQHSDTQILRTVSLIHLEIFYDTQKNRFFAQNLTKNRQPPKRPNPIIIDGKKVIQETVEIHKNTEIKLGKITITVKNLETSHQNKNYILKCSGPQKHSLTSEYEGLNCPYCGYVVFTGTML